MRLVLSAFALFALAGCDLIKAASNTTIVAGLVIASPEIALDNHFDVKPQVLTTAFVGERESATSTQEPMPITGATVTVQFANTSVTMNELADPRGFYESDSVMDTSLTYLEGETYTFNARLRGSTSDFGGVVQAPVRLSPATLSFTPTPGNIDMIPDVKSHPKNQELEVEWSPANGRYAYVTVVRANRSAPDQPQVVFDNQPKTAAEIIRFIAGDPPPSITIPAATFSEDAAYAVIVVTMDRGHPQPNTFLGSPFLAGSGAAMILAVGNFRP